MSRSLTLAGWVVLAVAAVALQLLAVGAGARRGRGAVPFGRAVDAAVARPAGRLLVLAGWLWLGWHVFVRSS